MDTKHGLFQPLPMANDALNLKTKSPENTRNQNQSAWGHLAANIQPEKEDLREIRKLEAENQAKINQQRQNEMRELQKQAKKQQQNQKNNQPGWAGLFGGPPGAGGNGTANYPGEFRSQNSSNSGSIGAGFLVKFSEFF